VKKEKKKIPVKPSEFLPMKSPTTSVGNGQGPNYNPENLQLSEFMNPLVALKRQIRENKLRIGSPDKEAQMMAQLNQQGNQGV
jgi:hypothetical protein